MERERPEATDELHDVRQRAVQRTALILLLLGAGAGAMAWCAHLIDPRAQPLNKIMPPLLILMYLTLAWRQWRHPEKLLSTLWLSWSFVMFGLATPAWYFALLALRSGQRLVDLLPPIAPMFLTSIFVLSMFVRSRHLLRATLASWMLIALPIVLYLAWHRAELESPRGLELMLSFGPMSLFIPVLVPLMRNLEERFRSMRQEGERLQALAERDSLIGLYNRRAGERFLATVLARSHDDAGLVMFDIDHFKRINDGFGHPAGDAVLVEVGRRVGAALPPEAIFVRWGGEEFVVLLPAVSGNGLGAIAERLRSAVDGEDIPPVGKVSASFGATVIHASDTLAQVVQRADEALYTAKAGGRNRVVVA